MTFPIYGKITNVPKCSKPPISLHLAHSSSFVCQVDILRGHAGTESAILSSMMWPNCAEHFRIHIDYLVTSYLKLIIGVNPGLFHRGAMWLFGGNTLIEIHQIGCIQAWHGMTSSWMGISQFTNLTSVALGCFGQLLLTDHRHPLWAWQWENHHLEFHLVRWLCH